ncbi:LOW QUALITY PROTEIN: insulin-like peptide INSL5 [Manacus vitellinus]|uniref:LOW QUALITY PROTEIN: insulin-like peptide INSL5 n=1 Tax=Manacus vitellinus TaxID=328815 RepID=UPI000847657D|nr:LOW QUALITY PROTEIN: insulin-like peptide INSL5 [Manacus vitellinus]
MGHYPVERMGCGYKWEGSSRAPHSAWLVPPALPTPGRRTLSTMRGTALALACLTLLIVAQGGQGEGNTVRLCGRDFVRAVVFTCGGSRWKRHLTDHRYLLESENPQPFPHNGDADSSTYTDQRLGTDREETHEVKSKPEQDLHISKMSVLSKREAAKLLTTSCCNVGCSRREISSLC